MNGVHIPDFIDLVIYRVEGQMRRKYLDTLNHV